MKTYLKTLGRMFQKHLTRFLSIILMVLITVGFVSGIGTATDKIILSLDDFYQKQRVSDFVVKSTGNGFSDEDMVQVQSVFAGESQAPVISRGMSVDVRTGENGEEILRLYFLEDIGDWTVNVPLLEDGSLPSDSTQTVCERADNAIKQYAVGEKVTLDFVDILDQLSVQNSGEGLSEGLKTMLGRMVSPVEVTVSGVVQSPLTIALDGEPSYLNDEDVEIPDTIAAMDDLITLDRILYLSADAIPGAVSPLLGLGDLYIAVGNRKLFDGFGNRYRDYVEEKSEQIVAALGYTEEGEARARVLTLRDNFSFNSLKSYADKVQAIGWVLMVAFLLVTALVVLSNMTRLVEEERAQIACLRTLGYSAFRIVFKYVLFAMVATGIGGVGSYFVGSGLAALLYFVFNFSYAMPPMSAYFAMTFYLIVFFIIVATVLFATLYAGFKLTAEAPANLLRPKPPKAGKKVFIERIPLLWNRLSFKYKSTMRNVLRYKSRFFMTVIAVAISMALVMAGLAILDLCLFGSLASPSIVAISVVVIAFAGLLTATIIYTMTNINVSERNRELATLMVLGYHDPEVAGYIYREIYVDTAIGIVFGYPLSVLLVWAVFRVMGLGTLGGVSWFMWLIAPFIVLLFTAIVTLMLRRKIVGIDMNESLKAIE